MADGTPDFSDDFARDRNQVTNQARVLALTAHIVAAHLANAGNRVGCSELPGLIHSVHASLASADATTSGTIGPLGLMLAVSPARSVFPDYIICLNDGLRFRTLRRHLMAAFGLTSEQYAGDGACPTTSL